MGIIIAPVHMDMVEINEIMRHLNINATREPRLLKEQEN